MNKPSRDELIEHIEDLVGILERKTMPSTETDRLIQQMLDALRESARVLSAFYPEKHKTLVQVREAINAANGFHEAAR